MKAHKCLQKLQRNKGSGVDEDVQARFRASTSSSTPSVESMETASLSPPKKAVTPTENARTQSILNRVMKSTAYDNDFLKRGINRYGYGQWTAIMRDFDFKFQKGRTTDSLKKDWTENTISLTTLQTSKKVVSLNVKLRSSFNWMYI